MNDNKITNKLRKLAGIYLLCLLLPFVVAGFTHKTHGKGLLFIVWPLASACYFIAYRQTAKAYECAITKRVAFSKAGGGSLHGVLYSLSSFIIFMLVVLLVAYPYL